MTRHITLLLCLAACVTGAAAATDPAPSGAEHLPLDEYERKDFSQFGEDGVIDRIFQIIEPTSRFIVEFGAHDGITNSNARNLVLAHQWGAFLIEGDHKRATALQAAYKDRPRVTTLEAWVFPGNIEILFEDHGVPKDLDFLVVDIDSNDYYVWRAIHEYRPKVVMIEANHMFPPPQLMVIDFHPMNYWDHTAYTGASLQSMYNLAKQKGYELIHCMRRGPNAFFVDQQYYARFGIADNTPIKMFRRQPDTKPWPLMPKGRENLVVRGFTIKKQYLHNR